MPGSPKLSVVIASLVGPPFIDECLASVEDEARELGAEIIVVAGGAAFSKGCTPGRLLRVLPLTALLSSAWAFGEFGGYLKGAPAPVPAAGVRTQGAA